jgi:hypothetical protein
MQLGRAAPDFMARFGRKPLVNIPSLKKLAFKRCDVLVNVQKLSSIFERGQMAQNMSGGRP